MQDKTVPLATFPYLIAYNLFSYRSRAEVDILSRWKSASMSDRAEELGGVFRLRRCLGVMPPGARRSYESGRLQGLNDEQRPGRPRTVTDEQVEKMITATLEQEPPGGDTH